MPCVVDVVWIQERIEAKKATIIAYEAAILAFGTSNIQSYRLSTGQTDQSVTRADVGSLRLMLRQLENDLEELRRKLCGGSGRSIYVRPAY